MLRYRCLVLKTGDGWAEVVIRPEDCHLVCAPEEIDKRLCHCATDSSFIVIKAIDPIGVRPGDHVIIHQIPKVGIGTILKLLIPSLLGGVGYVLLWGKWAYLALGAGIIGGSTFFIWELVHKKVPPPVIDEVLPLEETEKRDTQTIKKDIGDSGGKGP